MTSRPGTAMTFELVKLDVRYDPSGEKIFVERPVTLTSAEEIFKPFDSRLIKRKIDDKLIQYNQSGTFDVKIPKSFLPLWHLKDQNVFKNYYYRINYH